MSMSNRLVENSSMCKCKEMNNVNGSTQILIIHVKGNEERKRFVLKQIQSLGMPYSFIEEGNVEDLTTEILDRYFLKTDRPDTMYGPFPRTSCAYKHILAMQYILDHDLPGALVLEDDICLKANFAEVFAQSMKELWRDHREEPCMVNYENSSLLLVPRSQRRKGQILYRAVRDRFAGCLYITNQAARVIMDYIKENKSNYTSDRLHNKLIQEEKITYYWSYPCIACQCSCDGSMPTMIPTKPRPYKRLKWFYKKIYKTIIYYFR